LSDNPPISRRRFAAFLFDMDGTIINSIASAERAWATWASRHDLDVPAVLKTIHGKRAFDSITRLNIPGIDAKAEAAEILRLEMEDVEGIVPIPGAADFLASLPRDRWAVVTSAPRRLAALRLEAAGLPFPPMMVSGEEVKNGKPAPDCFLLGAERLAQPIDKCLIFEDAPAGIQAAEAAGSPVVVVTTTHTAPLRTQHQTISTYETVRATPDGDGELRVSFSHQNA
jgi:mannitol-1-/sugar-/sorbitol-6-phosphatase